MADTVEAGVQAGLNMLTARGLILVTWEHHEKGKRLVIHFKSARVFTTSASFGTHNSETRRDCTEDEVIVRLRAMMRTTRYKPIVFFVNGDNEKIPLLVPKTDVIDTRPDVGTEFIGADMMRLDHPPAPIDILQKFAYVPSEIVGGKAPRAYEISGLRHMFETGHALNPFTRVPFNRNNIRPTNNWRVYR